MKQRLAILGSTGSIGVQTLDIVRENPDRFEARILTAHGNWEQLARQAREFDADTVVIADKRYYTPLREALSDTDTKVFAGEETVAQVAASGAADVVVNALVGYAGLAPTVAALEAGRKLALANKESLVVAGAYVMPLARERRAPVLPIDSEHSAIFQCLQGCADRREIRRLILTCSGGPFYGMTYEEVGKMTKADALRHPNWTMGPKITVDCATLMNKGLEVIEAMRLYRLPLDQVSVVIHRQSIVHSLVEYRDGAVLAQLGTPDMRLPIRYAMTYPERVESPAEPLDLLSCPPLTFHAPDYVAFPCLALALEAAHTGGSATAVLNGANEEAVGQFLAGQLSFSGIAEQVAYAMAAVPAVQSPSLGDILDADQAAREAVRGHRPDTH